MNCPESVSLATSNKEDIIRMAAEIGVEEFAANMPEYCGVISVKRIVEYLVEHFTEAVFNLPPDPVQQQLSREGA